MQYKYMILIVSGISIIFGSFFLFRTDLLSQSPVNKNINSEALSAEKEKRNQNLKRYISNVQALPPEYSADLILKVIENGKVIENVWKKNLLDDVFRKARDVQNPFKRKELAGGEADSRAGYLTYAYNYKMDTLSLQLRAIKAMLQIDKSKAREMFSEIKSPEIKALTCEDMTVYDLSEFYNVFNLIIKTAFSEEDKRREEPVYFLITNIRNISSPIQIAPVIRLIASLNLPASQLQLVINILAERLNSLNGDDRSFSVDWIEDVRQITDLIDMCNRQKIGKAVVLNAFRNYMVNHFAASRCFRNQITIKQESEQLALLNKFFLNQSIPIITDKEATSTRTHTEAVDYVYFRGQTKARQIMKEVSLLHWLPGTNKAINEADKNKVEWRMRLTHVFNLIQEWHSTDEKNGADYFHQKAGIYRTLIRFVPDEPSRERIMKDYFSFLIDSSMQQESRIEWFFQLNNMIKLLRKDNDFDRTLVKELFSNSSNSVISLYTEFETL